MTQRADHQISVTVNQDITEVVMTGEVRENMVDGLVHEVLAIPEVSDAKALLFDVSQIKGRFGVLEAFNRVRNYPRNAPHVRVAIVDLEENASYEAFHVTTAANAGQTYNWFTDIDAARAWLKSKPKT